ncbi:MAG: hypothetical protein ACK5LN_14185 [Propioniciclava sp.]
MRAAEPATRRDTSRREVRAAKRRSRRFAVSTLSIAASIGLVATSGIWSPAFSDSAPVSDGRETVGTESMSGSGAGSAVPNPKPTLRIEPGPHGDPQPTGEPDADPSGAAEPAEQPDTRPTGQPSTDQGAQPESVPTVTPEPGPTGVPDPGPTGLPNPGPTGDADKASEPTTMRLTRAVRPGPAEGVPSEQPAPVQAAPAPAENAQSQVPVDSCFQQVFRDDFDGSSLNPAWSPYNSAGNAGYGLRRDSAIQVVDGKLVITAQNNGDGVLVSGGMDHELAQTYGRYTVRVRTDADPNMATSGVIITWPESGDQPRDGETNIYETGWGDPTRSPFYSYVHEPFQDTSKPTQQAWIPHYADGTQWQTMTMEWTPAGIRIVREGPDGAQEETFVSERSDDDVIPDVAHRLTVQLDAWKNSSPGTVRMEVDYIEIYDYTC